MNEPSTLRIETCTPARRDTLMAIFLNGYAAGWKMYVREAFKDALDIKLVSRVINKKKSMIWTQGDCFDFHIGDVFYSNDDGDTNPDDPDKTSLVFVQVKHTSPSGYIDAETYTAKAGFGSITKQRQTSKSSITDYDELVLARLKMDPGRVDFLVMKRNNCNEKLVEHFTISCSQEDFVVFLQTGVVRTKNKNLINLFENK